MNLKILQEMVLVEPDKIEEKTKGGVYIAPEKTNRSQTGVIIQVRPESKFKVGQRVYHSEFRGNEWVDENGNKRVLLKEKDILAILKD